MTTTNLTYRLLRRKHLLLLALTLLSLVATLPAAGQVVYSDLDKLKHLEKIEVTTSDATDKDGKAILTLPINPTTGNANLLDGDKSTSWKSWIQRQHFETQELLKREDYSANYTNSSNAVADYKNCSIEYETNDDGRLNYYLTTKPINRGKFKVLTGLDFNGHPAPNGISFNINIQGSKSGNIRILVGNDTQNTIATETNSCNIEVSTTPVSQEVKLPAFSSNASAGSDYIWIDASDYDGNLKVSSITDFTVGSTPVDQLNKSAYDFSEGISNYDMSGNNLYNLSFENGTLQVKRSSTESALGSFYVHRSLNYPDGGVGSPTTFKIHLAGTISDKVKVIITDNNGHQKEQEITLTGGEDILDVSFDTEEFRGEAPIKIDASDYNGDITVTQISNMSFDGTHIVSLDINSYPETNKTSNDYQISEENNSVSFIGKLQGTYKGSNEYSKDTFHLLLYDFGKKVEDTSTTYKVIMRARSDVEGQVELTLNNAVRSTKTIKTDWAIVEFDEMKYQQGEWANQTDWFSIWSFNNVQIGKLDIDWFEIYQINPPVDDGYTNSAETTGTAIATQHFKDWATTTGDDGKVHIPDAYKYDGYDPAYSNEDTDEATEEDHKGYITFKSSGDNNYNKYRQLILLSNLKIKKGKNYRVEVEVKADKAGSVELMIGSFESYSYSRSSSFSFTTDWNVVSVDIEDINNLFTYKNDDGNLVDREYEEISNGVLVLNGSTGNLQFRAIRVLELPEKNPDGTYGNEEILRSDFSNGWPYGSNPGKPEIVDDPDENGTKVVKIDFGNDGSSSRIYSGTFEKGRKYTFKAKMKVKPAVNDEENYGTKYDLELSTLNFGWEDYIFRRRWTGEKWVYERNEMYHPSGDINKVLKPNDSNYAENKYWQDVEFSFGPLPEKKEDFLLLGYWDYKGILYIKDIELVTNTIDKDQAKEYMVYSQLKEGDADYDSLAADDATSFEYIDGETVLYSESTKYGAKGLINLTLKPQTNYRVKVHLKTTNGDGDVNIRLGNKNYLQRQTVKVPNTGWQTIQADFFDFNINGDGYCVIEPGSSMTGDITVDWVEIMEVDPAVNDDSEMGYNYFDMTLPEAPKKDDVYYVYVRRGASGAPAGSAPMRFRVATINEGGGNEVQQGEFALGGFNEMSKVLHKENAYDQNVGINQFVRVEIPNAPNGGNTLRLYCTRNATDHNVIMQSGSGDNISNVKVPALEITEVGLYKLTPWKNVDSESAPVAGATWILPLISRFQIEANGIRANYPGACLKDAVDGFKRSRYTDLGASLFDYDPATTWELSSERQRIKDDYYIDLLLPKMQNVSSGKKSIKTVIEEYNASNSVNLLKNGKINMVVQFSRPRNANSKFPMEIRYCGSSQGNADFNPADTEWTTMLLPLPDAEEDILFSVEVDPSWERVRIQSTICLNQNSNEISEKNFILSEIRAYLEMPKLNLEEFDYDVLYNDRYFDFEKSDRGEKIKDWKISTSAWEHKKGVLDDLNNPRADGKKWSEGWFEVGENDNYVFPLIEKLNAFSNGSASVPLADYSDIDQYHHDDSDGLNETQSNKMSGRRQPSYVVTHDIYTLPGKRVDLYPYSDIHSTIYYEDQLVRWYDYLKDTTPENLYFFTDPKSVIKSNKGFYGSTILLDRINRGPGTVGSVYFGKKNGTFDYNIEDQWIAADFAINLVNSNFVDEVSNWQEARKDENGNDVTDDEGKVIMENKSLTLTNFQKRFGFIFSNDKKSLSLKNSEMAFKEPTITFRHIFHIKDGKKFAEEFSGSYDKNLAYNKKNRKYISARANADFTIRLDNAMPLGSNYADKDGGNDNTKSSYFYKRKGNDGETEYVRVCSYDIVAYDTSTANFIDFIKGIQSSTYKTGGKTDMFVPYDRSFYTNVGSIISSTLMDENDGVNWVPNNRGFARAIYCDAKKAKKGKYLVRLYGLDKDKQVITIDDDVNSNKPLVLAEYEVTFLPETQASFVPEHRLKNLNPNNVLYTHTEDYLEATYNSNPNVPPRKAVDFDKFSLWSLKQGINDGKLDLQNDDLSKIIYSVKDVQLSVTEGEYTGGGADEFHQEDVDGTQSGNYLKMPLKWTESNYGFGFDKTGDYNIFRLADHSSATVYNSAASRRAADKNPVDKTLETPAQQRGVYDRLFYNSNGEKKGMFYYVNAASDPGDMVDIKITDPCPGATLYVSGWVNEFNDHQLETANIIVNYYANITEDLNEDGTVKSGAKITRRVQMKGFETGYVPNHSNEMSKEHRDGKQGDWMHFYFSFVPNIQRVRETLASNEAIVDYSLILENNAISSWGADYAIDDIRAYMAPARVEAYQAKPICNSKDEDENLQIEVRLPYDALMESLGISEPENPSDGKYENIKYAILDKTVYDAAYKAKYKEFEDKYKDSKNSEDDPTNNISDIQKAAFVASVMRYPHMHLDTDAAKVEANKTKQIPWGTIYFNTYYDGNLEWEEGNYKGDTNPGTEVPANRAMKHDEYGERNISFISYPPMDPKKRDYMIVIGKFGDKDVFGTGNNVTLYSPTDANDLKLADEFKFGTNCCQTANFTLNKAAQKVVDGILYGDDDQITCCENQRPVVQLNLYRKEKAGNKNILDPINPLDEDGNKNSAYDSENVYYKLWENPYLDWYAGTYEEFMKAEMTIGEGESVTKTSLWEVLAKFRDDYPNSTTWDVPAYGEEGTDASITNYTKEMKEYLKGLYEQGKLQLYQASYVFPNLKLDRDEDGNLIKDDKGYAINYKDFYVTAVPIDVQQELQAPEYVVCVEPTEVKITVSNTSPKMKNGFASGITYPAGMDIVPLRLGLKHTDKSSIDGGNWTPVANTVRKDEITLNVSQYEGKETLVMPLRNLSVATTGVTKFKTVSGDPFCYLAETNDPYYRKLGQVTYKAQSITMASSSGDSGVATQADEETDDTGESGDNSETGDNGTNSANNYDSDFGLVPRGKITLDAAANTSGYFSNVKITFNNADMKFHEGYYYTFKFPYEEDYSTEGVEIPSVEDDIPCHGETYFTIKVVPEYQQWTGKASLNWNNDENWKRVSKTELLANSEEPSSLSPGVTEKNRFTVNETHSNTFSYAPLDFTKVIIPAGTSYPQLAARAHDRSSTTGSVSLSNGHGDAVGYVWAETAPKAATAVYGTESVDADANGVAASSYHPTLNIQYDMAAVTYGDNNVYCRPWYANACEQIHFNSNAEILNQQNLDYEKAWVDMEMTPHRWYTVASPLYGVVAGDMYLPKADGRQNTELFTDIKYDSDINDRFAPAVYQRGWDKGSETVYTVHNTSTEDTETVALASTWSHVYNDVTEEYAPGAGYSVKTDVTRLTDFGADDLVKFRFPKADANYDYYEDGKPNDPGRENGNAIDRSLAGRLLSLAAGDTTVTLTKNTNGNLFLVGNPFMAHLDMREFMKENAKEDGGVILPKFWIMSENQQTAAIMNTDGSITISGTSTDDVSLLAPMQGFFVEAKTAGTSLNIKFTPAMMAVQAYEDETKAPILKAPAAPQNGQRTTDDGQRTIRVSTEESTAIIRLAPEAQKAYVASEDVEMIDDSNQKGIRRIYTVAGNMASAINQTPDADGVEVGLMAPADSLTTVTFKGIALEDYLLYDTATGEMTQLYDGFTIEMKGAVSGRYFLTSGIDTAEIEDGTIRIMPVGHEAVVTAPAVCGELTVRVFDTLGREVAKCEGCEEEVRIALEPGIYVMEVVGSDAGRRSAKLRIR